uniref:HIG1 domain-containing protein n=1 Tax=Oncorhynchus kisutch TaxID=8019 RepID=A0A8C7GRM6_ONCKI
SAHPGPPLSATTTKQPMLDISKHHTFQEKLMRKSKENPFVPIGCLGTAGALMYGLRAFKQGHIFAQGFTVVAILFGVFTTALKKD